MTKPFDKYQYLEGEPETPRDVTDKNSKFWNVGKWDNFIAPLLPKDCGEMTFIDVGCNGGLFLKLAKDWGFRNVIGVEADKDAYARAIAWRDKNGYDYQIINDKIENCADSLPLADVTLLSNVHYYLDILDWLEYVDKLQFNTRYCLIITKEAQDRHRRPLTSIANTKHYFRDWKDAGGVYEVERLNRDDPGYRKIWSLLFESRFLERIPMDQIFNHKPEQKVFYDQLEEGVHYTNTKYYKYWSDLRLTENKGSSEVWTPQQLDAFVKGKAELLEDIKKNGIRKPIIIRADGFFLDGNHRLEAAKRLNYKTVIVRRT